MLDTKELLRRYCALYPATEIEDVVKLLYQSEFGGGHYIAELDLFCENLKTEKRLADREAMPAIAHEEIGGGHSRVHLAGLEMGLNPETFTKLCVLSAENRRGSEAGFVEKLRLAREMISSGTIPLPAVKWNDFIEDYGSNGYPPLRHSARYRALYQPHYRVLDTSMARVLPVFALVDRVLGQKPHVLLGIEGMCASGKSTLAELLARVYGSGIIHADDFFLHAGQRTQKRLDEPGGNIDYERLEPVAQMATQKQEITYAPYDCKTGKMGLVRAIKASDLTILEGAYVLHPKVKAGCDIRVFLMVDAKIQVQRVTQRNGPEMAQRFIREWIPLENEYFSAFPIRESCDIVMDTSGWIA